MKIRVSKDVPGKMMRNGKTYYLAHMAYFGGDIDRYAKQLREAGIKYRTIKYRHPEEKAIATLFYTRHKGK